VDCTLPIHVKDFDAVVEYLRSKKVQQLFAIGHSYGGLTILQSASKLDGAVLWDPTHGNVFHKSESLKWQKNSRLKIVGELRLYLDGWGYIEPKAIDDEQKIMGDTTSLAAHKGYPLKIIAAGKGIMTDLQQKYIKVADEPRELVIIDEAGHQFEDSDEVVLRLFQETGSWFKKILDGKLAQNGS
jgi:dienelactone hydrolase